MRPVLMIENLRNLHDARYCAAVGIGMVSFELQAREQGGLTAANVKEINDWLSGVEGVGCFGHVPATEIVSTAAAAGVAAVLVPADYNQAELKKLPAPVISDFSQMALNQENYASLLDFTETFPGNLFLVNLSSENIVALSKAPFLTRCILRVSDANTAILAIGTHGMKPYGLLLGKFSIDGDGLLDYDACDSFLDQFHALIPAQQS